MPRKVVIAGGGFGGFYAARSLERLLPAHSAQVTLVNDVNFMLYTPLLPGAAAGTLEPRHVVVPLREALRSTELRLGRVTGLSPQSQKLKITANSGELQQLEFDHLVVALGSASRMLPIPGLSEYASGFKTLAEAIHLRNHVINQLELAESTDSASERAKYLGFVFVGGGYAGLEALAELHDFATELVELYPRCRIQGMRWVMVEAADRVLTEIDQGLARFAMRELEGRGIEFRTSTTLASCDGESATLSDGEIVEARTLVWTAGVAVAKAVAGFGLPTDRSGRILVDSYLQVEGQRGIWAIGDVAAVPDPANRGRTSPPTAQHAIRQGKTAAHNIAASLGVGSAKKFRYKTRGLVVDLGRHQAVASVLGIKLRGFLAWWLGRTYHLSQLPGVARKLRLVVDWTVGLAFGRDASELSTIGHPPSVFFDSATDPSAQTVTDGNGNLRRKRSGSASS